MTLENLLCVWVVYDHPRDFPEYIVVRRHFATRSGEVVVSLFAALYDNIDAVREDMLNLGLGCLQRFPDDDPVIIETWI